MSLDSIFKNELDPAIYTDPELISITLAECENAFKKRGGQLVIFEKHKDQMLGSFTLPRESDVFPICSAGNCRSQVLHHILNQHLKKGKFRLHPPHAARTGYDPYHGNIPIQYYNQENDEFVKTFNHSKIEQFGFQDIQRMLKIENKDFIFTAENIKLLKDFYDQNFYAPIGLHLRIYIAFMRPVHTVLKRLIETNDSLHSVIVVAIPLDDEITKVPPHYPFKMRSIEAYKTFEAKLLTLFIT